MQPTTGGLRAAFICSLVIAFASGGLLIQNNVGANAPAVSRGTAAQREHHGIQDLTIATPTPTPLSTGASHSAATLTAPGSSGAGVRNVVDRFPPHGRYVYSVKGTESARPFGSRDYPPELTMLVSRPEDAALLANEIVFDLPFSEEHTEREIASYRKTSVSFTFESQHVSFGPGVSEESASTYDPPVVQVPFPLKAGAIEKGKTTVTASDGSESRIEDWVVGVERQETIKVLGRNFKTWVIRVERTSEPGSTQSIHRVRKYWFSTEGSIWLKWTEDATATGGGFGAFDYTSQYTAILNRFEPQ